MKDLSHMRRPLLHTVLTITLVFVFGGFVLPVLFSAKNDEGPLVGILLILLGLLIMVWAITKKPGDTKPPRGPLL